MESKARLSCYSDRQTQSDGFDRGIWPGNDIQLCQAGSQVINQGIADSNELRACRNEDHMKFER